jgi:hypothetical protein
LTGFVVVCNNQHYPGKQSQALLGSNLARDTRVQAALNNAQGGSSAKIQAVSSHAYSLFKPFCPCLKKPNIIDARSASDLVWTAAKNRSRFFAIAGESVTLIIFLKGS